MRNSGPVGRIRLESNRKNVVGILAVDVEMLSSGLVVFQQNGSQIKLRYVLGSDHVVAVDVVACVGGGGESALVGPLAGSGQIGSDSSKHAEDERERSDVLCRRRT